MGFRGAATFALAALIAIPSPVFAESGEGEAPRGKHSLLSGIGARPLSKLGDEAIRFTSEPALGGPATSVELRPDRGQYKVTVSYLDGHPSLGWRKLGAFQFSINHEEFSWLLAEIERAEREEGADDGGPDADGDIVVCTDGPGYLSEIRSHGHTRWISGFCGRNANNTIARLFARLVRFGTTKFLRPLNEDYVPLIPEP